MGDVLSVILAAGEGKRMNSKRSKVLHEISGKSLLGWVTSSVKAAGVDEMVVVVGNRSEQVKSAMGEGFKYANQESQLGTGHAVMQAREWLEGRSGTVLILCGDTPLVSEKTIKDALDFHTKNTNTATVITTSLDEPFGYGRIIRDERGNLRGIVEQKDATTAQKQIKEINSGMYCFDIQALLESLDKLTNENSQNEYYLTDTLEILSNKGLKVSPFMIDEKDEILGVNDRMQLATAQRLMNERIIKNHLSNGVSFISPETTFIDADVTIGMDTIIYPQVILQGKTAIGEDCVIGSGSKVVDSKLDNGVYFDNSCIHESVVGKNTKVGPFAYIRPGSQIGKNVKIGDFVEIKKASIGDNTKVSHLTYVGDAVVENDVNIGCGVVVVNYDGQTKHKTHVKENSFVGCNVNLISPVVVEKGAYIAAGTTVTENVPENGLAIGRSRQTVKENWVKKRKGDV